MPIKFPFSEKERERRFKLVREKMKEKGFDALIVTGSTSQTDKGSIRYLTNFFVYTRYLHLLFPLEGDPKTYVLWPSHIPWAKETSWIENVRLSAPAPKVTSDMAADLKQLGCEAGKIGLVGMEILPAPFYLDLRSRLPKAKLESATDIVLEARESKSKEEEKAVKKTVEIADKVFDEITSIVKVGRTQAEVYGDIERLIRIEGAEDSLISWDGPIPLDKVLKSGDVFALSVEPQGPGGYFQQMNRMICLGKPPKGLAELTELCSEAKEVGAEALIPGNKGSDVAVAVSQVFEKKLNKKTNACGHGMGLDLVENPLLERDDKTIIKPGMEVTIHPGISDGKNSAVNGDTYLVTNHKPIKLNRTETKLFVI